MALIKCPDCGLDVSSRAGKCPKCGAPNPERAAMVRRLIWVVPLMVAIVFLAWVFVSPFASVMAVVAAVVVSIYHLWAD